MKTDSLPQLKQDLQFKAKNGIDFIFAAAILWLLISYTWTLDFSSYNRSILTFMVGAILLPLAFGLSKVFKTKWKLKDNPLQPLGLWLNFAQLIYFPFLIFILIKYPDYFIMTYAIITGAHLFPYAWLYDEIGYAVFAVLIAAGSLLIALNCTIEDMWYIPLYTSVLLLILGLWIYRNWLKLAMK
ncbi:hypothetical protein J4050_00060 [Winogradskyella sp. DF17]|uniref:Uncharacterized protein n=1 Tax=Winogradskyella pelagia TaxID=2819984 RepID=A0ABS3SX90_9FLAO|nr:hypothetical protein [Winogradskyella sp. DF17]MBO3115118.1 hypothetical protein [Winogradskyella sp. DF17]